jgi:deoxyribonuclease V
MTNDWRRRIEALDPAWWRRTPKEAVAWQRELAGRVVERPPGRPIGTAAGIDVSVKGGRAKAGVVVIELTGLTVVDRATAETESDYPYVPGLLSMREGPAILEALTRLNAPPDVLVFDGQGRAHPRRMGIASHIGVLLDHPSVGCAKTRLCGQYVEPAPHRGAFAPLIDRDETVGAILRTRERVKPVFVSPGHLMDLAASVALILALAPKYRLPETTRQAHRLASMADLSK